MTSFTSFWDIILIVIGCGIIITGIIRYSSFKSFKNKQKEENGNGN